MINFHKRLQKKAKVQNYRRLTNVMVIKMKFKKKIHNPYQRLSLYGSKMVMIKWRENVGRKKIVGIKT